MTDRELVDRLLANDSKTMYYFFFVRCKAMLTYLGAYYCNERMSPEELIGELYDFLSADDWHKLRIFKFTCSLNSYVTIIASRYLQRKRDKRMLLLDEPTVYVKEQSDVQKDGFVYTDVRNIMKRMSELDQLLLQRILLDGEKPSEVLYDAMAFIPGEKLKEYSRDQLAGYIYTRYNRAKKTLQKELKSLGYYNN